MNFIILSGRSRCHLNPQQIALSAWEAFLWLQMRVHQYSLRPTQLHLQEGVSASTVTPGWHISDHQHGLLGDFIHSQCINLLYPRFSEWSCFLFVVRAAEQMQQRKLLILTHSESHIISIRSIWDHFLSILQTQVSPALSALSPRPAHLWSEDADSLCEALDICILPSLIVRGWRGGRRHEVGRVRQRVLLGEGLPAAVVALVGDVTLTQLCLQLPQVQPCLIVLWNVSKKRGWGYSCRRFGSRQMGFYCV